MRKEENNEKIFKRVLRALCVAGEGGGISNEVVKDIIWLYHQELTNEDGRHRYIISYLLKNEGLMHVAINPYFEEEDKKIEKEQFGEIQKDIGAN
jgi:hypothetical protein